MKYLFFAALGCLALTGCDVNTDHLNKKINPEVLHHTTLGEALSEQEIQNQVALSKAKADREVAKVDAETNVIKAKAQAEVNTLIENSVHDKTLLKNYHADSEGTSWTPVQNYCRSFNSNDKCSVAVDGGSGN